MPILIVPRFIHWKKLEEARSKCFILFFFQILHFFLTQNVPTFY